ncbi:Glycosyl transferase family 2 [Streptococcus thermophilus]|nr:ABC transporter permease [Streptococcus thermophilus]CAD0146964.1 Glycosyl transferase family 2 [Streptococcus thermophilus]CAD0151064.1 Glycosyl transferase family 2 [Streptococcus thermophilus]
MIAELFKERSRRFTTRCAKYSRYVFNDHFILVLLFLLGFVLVQYSQLLRHFPKNPWAIILGLLVLCLLLPFWGNIATYLEPADKYYLLVKEEEVLDHIKKATGRAFRFWVLIQTLIFILVVPLFLALGLPVWGVVLIAVAMAILKYFIFQKKAQPFYKQSGLNWTDAIAAENKRQQSILKFFSLFTNVKGITSSVKRRGYLDGILKRTKKDKKHTWYNLYLRAFLRSGDYFALSLRLFALTLLVIFLVPEKWLAMVLVVVFDYLLLFQLIALKSHFAYQRMANLMPIGKDMQVSNLKRLINQIVLVMTLIQALCLFDLKFSLILVGVMLVLSLVYLPAKLKKMID